MKKMAATKLHEKSGEKSLDHPTLELIEPLEGQIRECFARVVYSHKAHEKQADICASKLAYFKISQIILAALTTSGIISVIFIDNYFVKIITVIISLLSLFVTGYMKGFDPGAVAQKHRDTAADLWGIRELVVPCM